MATNWPPTNAEHATYTAEVMAALERCAGQVDEIGALQPPTPW